LIEEEEEEGVGCNELLLTYADHLGFTLTEEPTERI